MQDAYAQADYRWAAEILKHIVLNNPQNQQAKDLLANTYRQLGYAAEASTYVISFWWALKSYKIMYPYKILLIRVIY